MTPPLFFRFLNRLWDNCIMFSGIHDIAAVNHFELNLPQTRKLFSTVQHLGNMLINVWCSVSVEGFRKKKVKPERGSNQRPPACKSGTASVKLPVRSIRSIVNWSRDIVPSSIRYYLLKVHTRTQQCRVTDHNQAGRQFRGIKKILWTQGSARTRDLLTASQMLSLPSEPPCQSIRNGIKHWACYTVLHINIVK